jgi:uncharacterized metal-binding protein
MIYGIPLFRKRVAPRCTIADSILILKVLMNRVVSKTILKIGVDSWNDLLKIFSDNKVDTLVCGGINYESKILSQEQGISVIDNVACSMDEVIEAVSVEILKPGFGFSKNTESGLKYLNKKSSVGITDFPDKADCINCSDYKCLAGESCRWSLKMTREVENKEMEDILAAALDISFENERILCRLSELIYFAIEMNYKKIGIAYCTELAEPAGIAAQVLRRFFQVYSVCCKIGGKQLSDTMLTGNNKIECNPAGQADLLNQSGVDFNIIIGLCIGTDCIFSKLSNAPVSTLFVKDKSLANNPIGAVYSDYYLKEAAAASVT